MDRPIGPLAQQLRVWSSAGLLDELVVDDDAAAFAVGAGPRERLEKTLADALAGHLDETQIGDVEHLGARLVAGQRVAERPR